MTRALVARKRKIFALFFALAASIGLSWATTVTWDSNTLSSINNISDGKSFTKDGVTLTALDGMIADGNWMGNSEDASFKFSTSLGNFTKIEITGAIYELGGSDWTQASPGAVWTGDANETTFGSAFKEVSQIVFTIEEATTAVTGVTLDKSVAELTVGGENLTLIPTVLPSNATNKEVMWSSDNGYVAVVENGGVVIPVGPGTANITVTTVDGDYSATCVVTVTDAAPANACGDGLIWELSEGVLTISYTGTGTGVMDNYASASDAPWYSYKNDITSVTITDGVKSVGSYSFGYYGNLVTVTIGNDVETIGEYAFGDCYKFTTLNLGNSVKHIGNRAFMWAKVLTGFTLPSTLETIGDRAFLQNKLITSLTIPSNVTSIGQSAFMYCAALTSITVEATTPPTLKETVFDGVPTSIPLHVPNGSVAAYTAADQWNAFNIQGYDPAPGGGSTPANVCGDGLTWELNGGVLTISYDGEGTGEMYDFGYEYDENPVNVAPWKENKSAITTVIVGDGVKSIGNYAFNDLSENFTAVTIANSVERIGVFAFTNSEEITEITLPSSLKTIDDQGFANCGFTSITIPSGVTSIGYRAFSWCRNLTSLTCEATTPPTLASGVFYKISNTSSIPLYVPSGSVTAYEAAAQWNAFDIQGYDPASTANLKLIEFQAPASWENDNSPITSADFPGFVATTYEIASALPINSDEPSLVIFDFPENDEVSVYTKMGEQVKEPSTGTIVRSAIFENAQAHYYYPVHDGGGSTATVVTITEADFPTGSESLTKDGVTVSAGWIDGTSYDIYGEGSFSTTLGNFTKIEVCAYDVSIEGEGWSGNSECQTWTGNASSVSFSGNIIGNSQGATLKFTIGDAAATPAYETVMNLIDAIGTVELTAECKAKIDAARAAFIALSDGDKAQVTNYETLTTAEAAFDNVMDIWLSGDCDAILWKDTTLTIRKHAGEGNGAMADYTDYYGDNTAPWFNSHWYNPQPNDIVIKSVKIEEGVTRIGDYAFGWMSELKTLTIPSSVTSIGEDAFYWSKAVDDIYLTVANPSNLTWVLPYSADNQFKPEKATRCHVPADLLTAYQETFATLNMTFVGDLDPITPLTPEQQQALDAAKDKIAAIPSPVVYTPACKDAIDAARAAYDALTPDMLKQLVSNYATLTAAEATYENLKDVVVVEAKINEIPSPMTAENTKLSEYNKVQDARAAYDALTADQQALVSNYSRLTAAEAAFAAIGGGGMPAGALNGKFTINAGGDQIAFAKGNLQATTTDLGANWTWGFAANQWDYLGIAVANSKINGNGTVSENGTVDLFGWSTAATYYGINNSYKAVDYIGDFVDWGPNMGAGWRTLTKDEWNYLIENNTKGRATVNDKNGYIFLPDNWSGPAFTPDPDNFTTNVYSGDDWTAMENAGAVFLPSGPARNGTYALIANDAKYCSSTSLNNDSSYVFTIYYNQSQSACTGTKRAYGCMVRLVTAGGASPIADAQAAKDLIDAIGEVSYPGSKEAIKAAREAVDALGANASLLENADLQKLTDAETAYAQLLAQAVAAVKNQIDALPDTPLTDATKKLSEYNKVTDAREAYDALSDEEKAAVTNYGKLEAAEAAFAAIGGGTGLNVSTEDIGKVLCADGSLYATKDEATAASKTPVAMIAYVEDSKGLAIALEDESNTMIWSTAITTAAAHTPAVTGGTWKLPSLLEWQQMFVGCGADLTPSETSGAVTDYLGLRDKLLAAGGNGFVEWSYWTTTEWANNPAEAWDPYFSFSPEIVKWYTNKKDRDDFYIRAILAFNVVASKALADAQAAKDLIDAIPQQVVYTPECGAAIKAAREAVDALGENASLLDDADLNKLTQAEATYAGLLAQAVAAVKEQIEALPDTPLTDATKKLSEYNKVVDAREAYDALSDEEKAAVTNYGKLTAAEAAFAAIDKGGITIYDSGSVALTDLKIGDVLKGGVTLIGEASDKIGVRRVAMNGATKEGVFYNLPFQYMNPLLGENAAISHGPNVFSPIAEDGNAGDAWIVTDKNAQATVWLRGISSAALPSVLADAQAAKDLIDAIPQEVVLSDECNAAIQAARDAVTALGENASLLDDADIAKLAKAEADFALLIKDATAVADKIAAIGEVTFSAESKGKIEDAREAYEALSDELKPYVSNLGTLTAAEAAYEAARPFAPVTTVPAAVEALQYTGATQALITAGAAEHGTILYSLDGENYSTELPTALLPGAYTIYYKVQATDDYKDVAPVTVIATIAYNYPATYGLFGIPEGWSVKVNDEEVAVVNGAVKNIAANDRFDIMPVKPEDVKRVEIVPYLLDLATVTDSVIYVLDGDSITGTANGHITVVIVPDAKVYFKDVNLTNTGSHPAVLCGGNAEIVVVGENMITCTKEGEYGIRAAGAGTTLTVSGDKTLLKATIDPNGGTVNQ